MYERSMARADANEAVPSKGTGSNDAESTKAAHRSASAGCPFIANAQPARTARGGYCSMASAPTSASHRNTVLVWPDACVARTRVLSRWAQRSRSPVWNRCSRAVAGDPLASYQSAARRWSFGTSSGSMRRTSPRRNSRNSAW